MNHRTAALNYAKEHHTEFLDDLIQLTRIPSISTDPAYKQDVRKTSEWLAKRFSDLELEKVQIYPTAGHPIVYAEWVHAENSAPTILLYGHYDVQPAEPLDQWESNPFLPNIRDDYIYARGISDMKGQLAVLINAVNSIVRTGTLPVNLKFLIEGEEEIGSPNLGEFINKNTKLLACDFALNLDTGMVGPDLPTITYALRGLAYFEIRLMGPDKDLHSGLFGGTVHNPAQALSELISGMHDQDGRVTLPGFYDCVKEISPEERAELSRLPKDAAWYLETTGVPNLWGETEYTPDERVGARPTLEVNGLYSGFIGEGAKTIIPSFAMAKISCRLVPEQDPEQVHQQLLQYCKEHIPTTIRWELKKLAGGLPSISSRNSKWVKAFLDAIEYVWGVKAAFKREGGSVPVVSLFNNILGVETLNSGFGLPTDNVHSPNEKLHLPTWYKGIETLIHFFMNLGE